MRDGVMIINTSRGTLIDTQAAIEALKQRKIGALGMDVYENERDLFFEDKSNEVIQSFPKISFKTDFFCSLSIKGFKIKFLNSLSVL